MTIDDLALDLLVFRVNENRFGLDAAQIGEIVSFPSLQSRSDDAGRIWSVHREKREIQVVEMTTVLRMDGPMTGADAKLVIPAVTEADVGFLIGEPEAMVRVEAEEIEPLPSLAKSMVSGSGMWGIARVDGGLVILTDLLEALGGSMAP